MSKQVLNIDYKNIDLCVIAIANVPFEAFDTVHNTWKCSVNPSIIKYLHNATMRLPLDHHPQLQEQQLFGFVIDFDAVFYCFDDHKARHSAQGSGSLAVPSWDLPRHPKHRRSKRVLYMFQLTCPSRSMKLL